jgi:hypothetical protein
VCFEVVRASYYIDRAWTTIGFFQMVNLWTEEYTEAAATTDRMQPG